MKILLANVAVAEPGGESANFVENILLPAWRKNFNLVKNENTQIVSRFPQWGITGLDGFFYSYIDTLNAQSVLYAAIQAEKEGFDAVLITCFGDPLLWQIRQAVNIPVVSFGEASILMAAMMGYKFGVVTISPYNIIETEHTIAKYGLTERLAGIRANPESGMEQDHALINARPAIATFKKIARELIAKGAEIILPGCGLMSPALRLAPGAEDEYPNGITEVDGVPIADVMANGLLMAEMMVTLKQSGSSWISRKGLFAQATEQAKECGRMVLQDDRMKFWDIPL